MIRTVDRAHRAAGRGILRLLTWLLAVLLATAAGSAAAAISFRVSSSNAVNNGPDMTLTIPVGAGEGDLMVAVVAVASRRDDQVTLPAGWTRAAGTYVDGGDGRIAQVIDWKFVTAADVAAAGASWLWNWGGNRDASGAILVFRGVDAATPVEDAQQQTFTNNSGQVTLPSVTVGGAGRMLVGGASLLENTGFAWTAPMTEAADQGIPTLTSSMGYEATAVGGGATGTRLATAAVGSTSRIGGMVALRPAAVAAPRGYWKFDESGYTGAAGEVIDASGNGLHMQAFNGATTTATNAKFCRSAQFTGNATQRYLQIADNALLDIPDQLTITAWVRPASWPGSGLMSIASKDENYEFHVTASGQINWWWTAGGNQFSTGANAVPANTWTHVALVFTRGAQEIYINGALAGNNWSSPDRSLLAQNDDPFQIGQDQGFAGRYFDGLIDDFRIYAAALSQADVQSIFGENPPCPVSLDHYAISFPNGATGITCEPSQVQLTAHDASHGAVNVPVGTTLAFTTSTGTGVWQAGTVSGTGTWTPSNLNNGQATYVWPGGESSVTVNLRHATPVTLNVNVTDGTRGEAAAEDPAITFADSLFRFVEGAPTLGAAINPQISGKPSNVGYNAQSLVLQAIKTDQTGACTGLFNGPVAIQLAFECVDPAACQAGQQVAFTNGVTTTALAQNAAGTVGPSAGNWSTPAAPVVFGADSQAAFSFSYPDAGNIRLHARYQFTPPAGGLTATYGASGAVTVRPFGFRISGVPSGVSGPASAVFRRAGQNFDATLTAVAWKTGDDADADGAPDSQAQIAGNATTPNFGLEAAPATATVSHTLAEPAGGAAGALSNTVFSGFSAGARTQTMTYSEAGIVNLFATSANYLGSGQSVTAGPGGLAGVGRFVPDHFALSAGTVLNRATSGCAPASTFSYMNEPLRLQFTLTAQNTANVTTTNYRGAFARLDLAAPASFVFGARDVASGTNLTARIDTALGTSGAWANGVAANVQATLAITRASPDDPDGPFAQLKLGIAPSDPDAVTLAPAALDFSTTGGPNDRAQVGADTAIRFGRLRLTSAFGSELAALTVPMQVEYWNGVGFLVNTTDSCTTIPRAAIALSNYQGGLAACETAFTAATVAFANGVAAPQLAAPGAGNDGSVDLRVNLGAASGSACNAVGGPGPLATSAASSYLRGRWNATDDDGNPATNHDDDPTARASFGKYGVDRVPNQFIFRRENY